MKQRGRTSAFEGCSNQPLFALLRKLDAAKIHYTLGRYREETILVTMTLVGERVEVDVFDDGHMEVSRFKGSEAVLGGEQLVARIIQRELQNT